MIVPTKILIWITPDEKILGKSFLKKNFTFFFTFFLKLMMVYNILMQKN